MLGVLCVGEPLLGGPVTGVLVNFFVWSNTPGLKAASKGFVNTRLLQSEREKRQRSPADSDTIGPSHHPSPAKPTRHSLSGLGHERG